ncbi:MAG: DEAD/DEAH box helicase [Planctomycetota bacterium]|nr:MAG: DEAD/DEAH box helicase [Planctomycetota bacterium]
MSTTRRRSGGSRGRRSPGPRNPAAQLEPLHLSDKPPDIKDFHEWDLGDEVQGAIAGMNIHRPTPIQALAIGPILEGRDVIAKAETGTGKTLAFGAPMIARIDPSRASVLGLVLSPTRELAEQVYKVLEELGAARGVKVALIVGGEPLGPQVDALQKGAQVVVGTPGRILDMMNQGFLSFPWTEWAILDEADKMLEIGFVDDVKKILDAIDEEQRQTLLFSATFPTQLLQLARDKTKNPAEIATAAGLATVDTIGQYFLTVTEENRARALSLLINSSAKDDVFLVFCDRRTDVDRLMRRMERERFSVKALHGGYDQAARFRVMGAFRTGEVKALIATDVASRGLDVLHVTHVVNFGVPRDVMDYTHRIGRTGRAGRKGTAITLVGPSNERYWNSLVKAAPWTIEEIPSPYALFESPPARRSGRREDARSERSNSGARANERPRSEDDDRGPRRRRSRGRSQASDAPRERPTAPDPPPPAPVAERDDRSAPAPVSGGFGAGLATPPPAPQKKPRQSEELRRDEQPRARGPARGPASTGFGAGL